MATLIPTSRAGSVPGYAPAVRLLVASLAVVAVIGACSGDDALPAPQPGPVQTVCLPEVCVDYPADWDIELGADFISFTHPLGAAASVGRVDMQGVVASAGQTWPADAEETMQAFWALLDELGEADLRAIATTGDGIVDSEGTLDNMRLWHRLVMTTAPMAWGAELRGEDASWSAHAAIITGSLRLVGDP